MREKSQSAEQAVSWDGACEPRVTHTTATLRWAVTRLPRLPGQAAPAVLFPVSIQSLGKATQRGLERSCKLAQQWQPGQLPLGTVKPLGQQDTHKPQQQKCNRKMPFSSPRHVYSWHGPGGPQVSCCYCSQGQEGPALLTPL